MLNTVITSLFKKSSTVLYPMEKREVPQGMRGQVVNGVENCTLCGICQNRCPTGSITVSREEQRWAIARFECIQCGHCVSLCPRKCLTMSPARPEAVTEKVVQEFHVPFQAKKPSIQ
jgi:formate hydrogenlyase subunit 6/NADH:ubiquinone oxidoreductase subunit I